MSAFPGEYLFGSVEPDQYAQILLGTARTQSVLNAELEENGCDECPCLSRVKIVQSREKIAFFRLVRERPLARFCGENTLWKGYI